MIYLIFSGMCKDCTEADIEIDGQYFVDGKKLWRVTCNHYNACLRMKQKEDENDEEDDGCKRNA